METNITPTIPSHMHGKWYLNQETMIDFCKLQVGEDFDLVEFCQAFLGFKLSEEAREELGEEQWNDMKEAFTNFEMMANAAFEISANSVNSDLDEHLQLISVAVNGEETTIQLRSENEEGLVEETTLVKNVSDGFISFNMQNLSGKLVSAPVDLLYGLS